MIDSYDLGHMIGSALFWLVLLGLVFYGTRFIFDMFRTVLKDDSSASKEVQNILICKEVYDNDSIDGVDFSIPLYYLVLHNAEREFNSSICLCESELKALKTLYTVEHNYNTKKVYSLELKKNDIKILESVQTTLQDVYNNEKLRENFNYRLSEGITQYSKKDLNFVDDKCELIWDMDSREPQFLVKRKNNIIVPKNQSSLDGGHRVMIDSNGKYGVIYSKNSYKNIDYKVKYDFKYHYIRKEAFGNLEFLENELKHNGDYKKLICDMIDPSDENSKVKQVLLNSTTMDEHITIDANGLLTQHTKNGFSKPYKTIIQNFHKIKAVECENGLWGYIDKDAKEIIACKYEDWDFFRAGYCRVNQDDKFSLIDANDKVVIESCQEIQHYEENLFFVKKESKYAVYKNDKIYIKFMNLEDKIQTIKEKNSLNDEELVVHLQEEYFKRSFYFTNSDNPYHIILRGEIQNKKRELQNQKYTLKLKEYVKLFDTFTSDKSLKEAGLWGEEVKMKDGKTGSIGWNYPSSADIYDMSIELPVDGFGKPIEELELIKLKNRRV